MRTDLVATERRMVGSGGFCLKVVAPKPGNIDVQQPGGGVQCWRQVCSRNRSADRKHSSLKCLQSDTRLTAHTTNFILWRGPMIIHNLTLYHTEFTPDCFLNIALLNDFSIWYCSGLVFGMSYQFRLKASSPSQ